MGGADGVRVTGRRIATDAGGWGKTREMCRKERQVMSCSMEAKDLLNLGFFEELKEKEVVKSTIATGCSVDPCGQQVGSGAGPSGRLRLTWSHGGPTPSRCFQGQSR